MNDRHMFDILKKIFNDKAITSIQNVLVFDSPDGYELFGEYIIRKHSNGYSVEKFNTDLNKQFYNLKNAVIWTTLYKRNLISDAKRIMTLDASLESALTEIKIYLNLSAKAKNIESKSIYIAKLVEAKHKKTSIFEEIQELETSVKNWQYSKYKQLVA
jgi:hypothetical protein